MKDSAINHGVGRDVNDFTTRKYVELLQVAARNYEFIAYPDVTGCKERFILWRHDCDFSLNRALRLAQLELEQSVKSTYFVNPHSEFYNIQEKSQTRLIREIIHLGHDIGLHFDAEYYDVKSEDQLSELVEKEATWLSDWFAVEITAFSFHNPTEFLLSCEDETYGKRINTYSNFFKNNVGYCSDSNGYWRFRSLGDVLEKADDRCLQVLTHPGWWQEESMLPRERIIRSINGRAEAVLRHYDNLLQIHGRPNIGQTEGNN